MPTTSQSKVPLIDCVVNNKDNNERTKTPPSTPRRIAMNKFKTKLENIKHNSVLIEDYDNNFENNFTLSSSYNNNSHNNNNFQNSKLYQILEEKRKNSIDSSILTLSEENHNYNYSSPFTVISCHQQKSPRNGFHSKSLLNSNILNSVSTTNGSSSSLESNYELERARRKETKLYQNFWRSFLPKEACNFSNPPSTSSSPSTYLKLPSTSTVISNISPRSKLLNPFRSPSPISPRSNNSMDLFDSDFPSSSSLTSLSSIGNSYNNNHLLTDSQQLSLPNLDDVTSLPEINHVSITDLLESRFNSKSPFPCIYTYIGDMLISLNPYDNRFFKKYYKTNVMQFFHKQSPYACSPHLFSVAESAFRLMRETHSPQTIIINGESGAGKTMASKLILNYLTEISLSGTSDSTIKNILLESNYMLEAFGNAKTVHCDNSSRFGKHTKIYFGFKGRIEGGKVSTVLLEKARVTRFNEKIYKKIYKKYINDKIGKKDLLEDEEMKNERNFHIFYQLLRGCDKKLKDKLFLKEASNYSYLNYSEGIVNGVDDKEAFIKTVNSMESVGITEKERKQVFRIMAGILHLGNVIFKVKTLENGQDITEIENIDALELAATCFKVDVEILKHNLLTRTIKPGERTVGSVQEIMKAVFNRDALAKKIYEKIFMWLITRVNQAIKPKTKDNITNICILDLYGFEINTKNYLDQLNINYVNEKLQQSILEELNQERKDYINEQIMADENEISLTSNALLLGNGISNYIDNNNDTKRKGLTLDNTIHDNTKRVNDCVAAIENVPSGIYAILEEEDMLKESTSHDRLIEKLKTNLKDYKSFEQPRFVGTTFKLHHFAATVEYDIKDWVDKNKDTLYFDLVETMCKSKLQLLQELFSPEKSSELKYRKLQETIVRQFKRDVEKLLTKKLKGKHHYIYCIKSNNDKKSFTFDRNIVDHQVQYLAISSVAKIKQCGYFFKMKYDKFLQRYKPLSPMTWPNWTSGDIREGCDLILQRANIDMTKCAKGTTQLFLKTPIELSLLNSKLEEVQHSVATLIQRRYREYVSIRSRRRKDSIKNQLNELYNSQQKTFSSLVNYITKKNEKGLKTVKTMNEDINDFEEYNVHQIVNGERIPRILVVSLSYICIFTPDVYELLFFFPIKYLLKLKNCKDANDILILQFKFFGDFIFEVIRKNNVLLKDLLLQKLPNIDVEVENSFKLRPSSFLSGNDGRQLEEFRKISSTIVNEEEPFIKIDNYYLVEFVKDYTTSNAKFEMKDGVLYIFIRPNVDIFLGKKNRRNGSFYKQFIGDALVLKYSDFMKDKIEHGEDRDVLFSDKVIKMDKRFKVQHRALIITERSIFLMHINIFSVQNYGNFFSKTRRLPLRRIKTISVSPFTDNYFCIHVEGENDVMLESVLKTEIISIIHNVLKSSLDVTLTVNVTDQITQRLKSKRLRTVTFVDVTNETKLKGQKPIFNRADSSVVVFVSQADLFLENK
ncbi:hypothetical protein ABK040_003372 [Willaertia magna]